MFKSLKDVVFDKRVRIMIFDDKINVNNYEDILIFDDEKVLIKTSTKMIKITGENLVITRLLNREVLVEGDINKVELE